MNKKESVLSQSGLKEQLRYCEKTGDFVWIVAKRGYRKDRKAQGILRSGRRKQKKYRKIRINGRDYLGHRLAWLYMTGEWPSGQIDHINGDSLDNRFENLRVVSNQENSKNSSMLIDNTSGQLGVVRHSKADRWVSNIWVDGKYVYLGMYIDFNDAVKARKEAEKKYGFHENHGKIPHA